VSRQEAETWVRPAGRVIVVDAADRVLLIRSEDPSIDVPVLWLTPGGACERGETAEAAAIRELWEETGIRAASLGSPVWRRRHLWRWGEQMVDSREDFFFFRCGGIACAAPVAATPFEARVIRELRWWSLEELQSASGEYFVPRQLPKLTPPLLDGVIPDRPLDVGA